MLAASSFYPRANFVKNERDFRRYLAAVAVTLRVPRHQVQVVAAMLPCMPAIYFQAIEAFGNTSNTRSNIYCYF